MKKAVIEASGRQFVVAEGDEITVNLLQTDKKESIVFEPLMVVDGKNSKIGMPQVKDAKVTAKVVEADKQAEKVTAIRYKSKKRVHKRRGHRQRETILKISSIA